MARRRWVQIDGELIEVTPDYVGEQRNHNRVHGDLHYDGLRAPDGTDISTRTKHREYMKATGLTTIDDFKGDWARAEKARDEYRTRGGTVTREDIGRAIAQLERGR